MQLPVRPVGGSGPTKGSRSFLPRPLRGLVASIGKPLPRPVRVALLCLAPVLLILASLGAIWSMSGGVTLRALEQHQYNADTSPPQQGEDFSSSSMIGQSFLTPRDGINRIAITLSTPPNFDVPGQILLLAGDGVTGTVLYSSTLTVARFDANPYLAVDVPTLAADTRYTILFQADSGPLTQSFAVRYNTFDALSSGSMYSDTGRQDGDLTFSLYYTYGIANLLSDIAGALSGHLFTIVACLLLLFLPGLALLSWLASGLNWGQRVLAAPALTILALPVLLLVAHSAGLPLGAVALWLVILISGGAFGWALYRNARASRAAAQSGSHASKISVREKLRLLPIDLLFWGLLALIFVLTLSVRLMALRDATAGLGVDAYHHTLISRMIIDSGGVPQNYVPYAGLSSFTYHFGFHSLVAAIAWLTDQTSPENLLLLMPQLGQFGIALPVLTLTLFGWRAFNNRWAGLIAGAFAGLACVFPAFYVNWSRYTQGLGLALLPVTWVLTLNIFQFPDMGYKFGKSRSTPISADPSQSQNKSEIRNLQSAIDRSGPYILGVVGIAGLFLTHYRIAMIYVVIFTLYVGVRLVLSLTTRRGKSTNAEISAAVIVRRSVTLGLLTLAALSPWLINLAQNFHSHLVGRESDDNRLYYDITDMLGFLTHPSMWALYVLGFIGLMLALKQRAWSLVLLVGAWLLIGLWSSPYLLDWLIPGFRLRLPFSGYLDINTYIQTLWLPLSLLAGYAVEWLARNVLHGGNSLSGAIARFWRTGLRATAASALVLIALAVALPIGANLDGKPYFQPADREALLWMRANLPRNAHVLSNPFAFRWAQTNVYGSDSGLWIPLMSGVATTVPPLPAYNESQATPAYLDDMLNVIQYEPFNSDMNDDKWQELKAMGITHIYVGSRSGALNVPLLLASDRTTLIFHKDAVYVFEIN